MEYTVSTATENLRKKLHLTGSSITSLSSILFCFAVMDEARYFRAQTRSPILITGIGNDNARAALEGTLSEMRISAVLTCGFAGGLNPALSAGAILHSCDKKFEYSKALERAGSQEGIFYSSSKILVTPQEKASAYKKTGADAVEMESAAIHEICKIHNIPCATVRVISDPANEELPLNFNSFMSAEMKLCYSKMALALCLKPWRVPKLVRFSSQVKHSAKQLSDTLTLASREFI